jgi:hypothetical protein
MAHVGRRIALVAIPLALLVVGTANAKVRTSKHSTNIVIHHVYVTPQDRLLVDGILRSDGPACRIFNPVFLKRQSTGFDEFLDASITSVLGAAWSLRSDPGVVDDSRFYLKTDRNVFEAISSGRHGRTHRRKIVCRADRIPVQLP